MTLLLLCENDIFSTSHFKNFSTSYSHPLDGVCNVPLFLSNSGDFSHCARAALSRERPHAIRRATSREPRRLRPARRAGSEPRAVPSAKSELCFRRRDGRRAAPVVNPGVRSDKCKETEGRSCSRVFAGLRHGAVVKV